MIENLTLRPLGELEDSGNGFWSFEIIPHCCIETFAHPDSQSIRELRGTSRARELAIKVREVFVGAAFLFEDLLGVIYRLRVVALQEPHPDGVRAVELDGSLHVEDVAQGLGHLVAREGDHPVVCPGADKGAVRVGTGALGELVLVVGEEQVRAATVDVRPVGQVLLDHRRALDVPARTPTSPRALPRGLAGLRGLPEREVERALLETGLALLRLAHLLGALVRELAVLREAFDGVVDVAVAGGVSVALLDELLNKRDHLRDMLCRPRLDIREADAEHVQALMEGVGIAAHDHLPGDALLVCPVDDLVLYIRYVLDEHGLVSPTLQVPRHHVPEQGRPDVADVRVVVDRRPADVEAYPAALTDLDQIAAQGVPYGYAHASSLASLALSILSRASSAPSTAKRYANSGPLFLPVSANRKGWNRSRVFMPLSPAHARSSPTKFRASSTLLILRPSRELATCAKTSPLESGSSLANEAGSTGPMISAKRRGASDRSRMSSLIASTAGSSRPFGRGSVRNGSGRGGSPCPGQRRMRRALKKSRRSRSKVAGLAPRREGSHSLASSSRSANSSLPPGCVQPKSAR